MRSFLIPLLLVAPATAIDLPKVPDGFTVELVLQAPDIEAPTALAVAPNGDVYYAEDPMDMAGPTTKNIDRIWMLKGGDPRKKILVAERMWAVMGLEVVRDRLFVVHPPYVTVFALDAEGKPTQREDLFADLGPKFAGLPSFNDHVPSGIRMGMDGWLYVSIGDKGIPKMTRKEGDGSWNVAEGRWRYSKDGNSVALEGGGVVRFRPDGSKLEVFASGTRNHLDVPLDEHDRIFVRDNTDDGLGWNTRLMVLPRGGFLGYPWAHKQRPNETLPMVRDFGGGSPCGGCVYLDDGLPETYRGRVFHCEWGQGKVAAVKLEADGAGFKFVDQIEFLLPDKVKDFRPFSLRPTADGRGFYVTDWGYSGWLAKTKAGRLWKVTYTKGDATPAPRGEDRDPDARLVEALNHPAHSERLRAQRLLILRGKTAFAALDVRKLNAAGRRHAVWVWHAWNTPAATRELMSRARDDDAGVRQQAVRALGERVLTASAVDPILSLLRRDPSPAVRHEATQTLRFCAPADDTIADTVRAVKERFDAEEDRYVQQALVRFVKYPPEPWGERWREWAEAVRDAKSERGAALLVQTFAEQFERTAVVELAAILPKLSPARRRLAVEALARTAKDRLPYTGTWWGTQPTAQKPPSRTVAWDGTATVRDALVATLADRDAEVRRAAVAGLIQLADEATFRPLVTRFARETDAAAKVDLVRAIAGLMSAPANAALIEYAEMAEQPEAVRVAALEGLTDATNPPLPDALARSIETNQPVAVQVRGIETAARLKVSNGAALVARALANPNAAVRRAAVRAVPSVAPKADLIPLLEDADRDVRLAVVQTLGQMKARPAIPDLIVRTASPELQFDAITALAKMPDVRAVPAYLGGLTSKNPDLRSACRQALAEIREPAAKLLTELHQRNEIPAAAVAELRTVYAAFDPIVKWRLIGPFAEGKVHPPESQLNFAAEYEGEGKKVKWRDKASDLKSHGRVNLSPLYEPNERVVAYGYAEFESPEARDAQLLVGSDDSVVVWLNGAKVHEYGGNRGWVHNQDRVNVAVAKGLNRLLVKCGNATGAWDFSVAVSESADRYPFLKGGPKKLDLEQFRSFARSSKGDAERGRKLFADVKGLACAKCHAVAGTGGTVGPDVAGIALKYDRDGLMTSVLEPSKTIAQGYETIKLELTNGKSLVGVFKGETPDEVRLTDVEGKPQQIPKKQIEECAFSPVSTMPNGLSDGMTLQDFADVIAYLMERREKK